MTGHKDSAWGFIQGSRDGSIKLNLRSSHVRYPQIHVQRASQVDVLGTNSR